MAYCNFNILKEMGFQAMIFHCKAILGGGQPGLMMNFGMNHTPGAGFMVQHTSNVPLVPHRYCNNSAITKYHCIRTCDEKLHVLCKFAQMLRQHSEHCISVYMNKRLLHFHFLTFVWHYFAHNKCLSHVLYCYVSADFYMTFSYLLPEVLDFVMVGMFLVWY